MVSYLQIKDLDSTNGTTVNGEKIDVCRVLLETTLKGDVARVSLLSEHEIEHLKGYLND